MHVLMEERQAGFTLIELLVVVLLMGVVGGMVTTSIVRGLQTSRDVQQRIEGMAELQMAAERVSRELRAACPITALGSDDVEVSVIRSNALWRHRFYVENGALVHASTDAAGNVAQPARPLVTGLDPARTAFEFFDRNGDAVPALAADTLVRSARISLAREVPGSRPLEVVTQVTLRNGGRSCD